MKQDVTVFFIILAFIGLCLGISSAVPDTSNTLLGDSAGYGLWDGGTGTCNTFIGQAAGYWDYIGSGNTFVGCQSGGATVGSDNAFFGVSSGAYNDTGARNVFLGKESGHNNHSGSDNVFVGYKAGYGETGSNMLYIDNCHTQGPGVCDQPLIKGNFAARTFQIDGAVTATSFSGDGSGLTGVLKTTLTTANSTFLGTSAGAAVTTGTLNTFIGANAGNADTTGSSNTFVGREAGKTVTITSNNTFIGDYSGAWATGGDNTFVGKDAGLNTSGSQNSFFGSAAGFANGTGQYNVFIGLAAGQSNNQGSSNTFVGRASGVSNTTGSSNTFLGFNSGYSNAIGSRNVFLGDRAGCNETGSDMLYIDNCYTGGSCDQPLIKGNFAARTLQIDGSLTMVTVATPSDVRYKKHIHPLESSLVKVRNLQGVTYEWDQDRINGAGYKEGKQIGLIAQEVEKVLPELVHTDGNGYKTLSYDKLVPVLIEAIKEQQDTISRLEKTIETMHRRLTSIEFPSRTAAVK